MQLLKKYYAVTATIIVFIIYLFTLAPSVVQIDSGELAAVQATLGIAHPTGYPLFTILGYLFLKIPLPFSLIYKANLLAAIWSSLGIYFFIKTSEMLLRKSFSEALSGKKTKKIKVVETEVSEFMKFILPAIFGGLFLAFSKTYWMQSTSIEVYSLQVFLFTVIIFLSLKAYNNTTSKIKYWIFVAVSLAFGFANHMTTMLLLPLIAILFFNKEKFIANSYKKILIMLAVFFPMLILIYSFLPIRASTNPSINWGNPINFENFWRHFTGKQYQVWLFSSFDAAGKQFSYFLKNLPEEFVYVGLIIIALGLVQLFRQSKKVFWFFVITFAFALLYTINYDIVDIDSYFLLSYIILGLFAAFGFQFITLNLLKKISKKFIPAMFGTIIIFIAIVNYSKVDQSEQFAFEDYTLAALNSVEKNSIIFSYQWDYLISPAYYFQFAEGFRKDVAVIDKELLRRSWYYNQLEINYPEVVRNMKPDISNFLEALKPFERDLKYDSALLENNYRNIMTKLITENINERNFYIGLEFYQNEMQRGEFSLPKGYQLVPHLIFLKVVKDTNYVEAPKPDFNIRLSKPTNKYTEFIENSICTMLTFRSMYELQNNQKEKAKMYADKIRKDYPEFRIPNNLLRQLY